MKTPTLGERHRHLAEITGPLSTLDVSTFRGPYWLERTRSCLCLETGTDRVELCFDEAEELAEVLVRWVNRERPRPKGRR